LSALAIIELIVKNLTDRIALGVLFLSIILLCIYLWFPGLLGGAFPWLHDHPLLFVFGILGPICYIPTGPIISRFQEWQANDKIKRDEQKKINEQRQILYHLTFGEKAMLSKWIVGDYRSRRIPVTDPIAQGLEDVGVLYAPNVPVDSYKQKAYGIQDWVKEFLKQHPELLK
jgi:Super-infection exclusion protein B